MDWLCQPELVERSRARYYRRVQFPDNYDGCKNDVCKSPRRPMWLFHFLANTSRPLVSSLLPRYSLWTHTHGIYSRSFSEGTRLDVPINHCIKYQATGNVCTQQPYRSGDGPSSSATQSSSRPTAEQEQDWTWNNKIQHTSTMVWLLPSLFTTPLAQHTIAPFRKFLLHASVASATC